MHSIAPVNLKTGEIMTDTHGVYDKEAAARRSKAFKEKMERRGRGVDFTFTDMENIKEVIKGVKDKHCGYLLYLQCFINYSGCLVNTDTTSMSKEDIQETLGLGKSAFYEFFNAMISNKIIYKANNVFYINEKYHFKGRSINQKVIKSFTFRVKKLYNKGKAKDLGFIYKLLPFVHYATNTICNNPYETDIHKIRYLPKNEIAKLTNESDKTVYNRLRRMKIGKEYVFAEIRIGKERFYKINPFLFYRQDGEPDDSLKEIFLIGFSGKT